LASQKLIADATEHSRDLIPQASQIGRDIDGGTPLAHANYYRSLWFDVRGILAS